ncbi:hypothetical protein E4U53_007811 [Claviceps sorghi]|nr:hypothetical protein E4U53_007811 [Claviceps sorghi]
MKALVQSYPPLGQVTVVQSSRLSLTVILEVSAAREREPWEASLWTSVDGDEWHDVKLGGTDHRLKPQMLQTQPAGSTFLYFSGLLSLQKCAKFTIKFRSSSDKAWRWVRDEDGLGDGTILLPCPEFLSDSCSRLQIPDLDSEWAVTPEISQSPGTRLWSLRCLINGSAGKDSSVRTVEVGTPWGSFLRYALCSRTLFGTCLSYFVQIDRLRNFPFTWTLVKLEQQLIPPQMVRPGASPACMVGSSTRIITLRGR